MEDSSKEFNIKDVIVNNSTSNDFEFYIGNGDLIFVLTRNNGIYPNNTNNMISKTFMIKDLTSINLNLLSNGLSILKIGKLSIIDINKDCPLNTLNVAKVENDCLLSYIEINHITFIKLMLADDKFLERNKDVLYILRDGNFSDIKAIFSKIEGCDVNICRGSSQKSHLLSPLEFRLSNYIMALFNFNYRHITYLNKFSDISKDKYLSWTDNFKCNKVQEEDKSFAVDHVVAEPKQQKPAYLQKPEHAKYKHVLFQGIRKIRSK